MNLAPFMPSTIRWSMVRHIAMIGRITTSPSSATGVGTVAGGAISATTAAALTTALGNTYIGLMTKIAKGEMKTTDLSTKEGQEAFKREFKAQMKAGKG